MTAPTAPTAKARFERLHSKKSEVLRRGREASKLTIPAILPPEGHTEGSKLSTPHQALGARAVNTLAAKMLLALFPPNTGFFKLNPDEDLGLDDEESLSDLRNALSKVEQRVLQRLENTKLRSVFTTAFKHLIVVGNGLVDVMPDGQFRFFGLNHYVVDRDPAGNVLTMILRENVSPATLDEKLLAASFPKNERMEFAQNPEKTVQLYTVMTREDNRFRVYQELNGKEVEGSEGFYKLREPRFIALRWSMIPDEDYGRGMVDEYLGDFVALDDLSRDLLKGSAAAAKVLYTCDPNSTIRPKDIVAASSGDVLSGKASDVGTIGLDKFADFRITLERLNSLEESLERAFLVHSSIQRDAERVTAEEIRYMAQELEDALGGVYSVLAQELQNPLVNRYLALMKAAGDIPRFNDSDVHIQVTTGLQALGRGHSLNKLLSMVRQLRETMGEERAARKINEDVFVRELETGFGLSIQGLWLSDEEVRERAQQAQLQQTLQDVAPGAVKQFLQSTQGEPPNG